MKRITLPLVLLLWNSLALAQQCNLRDQESHVNEYMEELMNQVETLEYLGHLITKDAFFQNSAGICPDKLGSDRVPCFQPARQCLCIGNASTKVSWFRADAFCKYHGMQLISITSFVTSAIIAIFRDRRDLDHVHFWTSGRHSVPPGQWIWSATGSRVSEQIKGITEKTADTKCLKWSATNSVIEEANCIGDSISLICQQNVQIAG